MAGAEAAESVVCPQIDSKKEKTHKKRDRPAHRRQTGCVRAHVRSAESPGGHWQRFARTTRRRRLGDRSALEARHDAVRAHAREYRRGARVRRARRSSAEAERRCEAGDGKGDQEELNWWQRQCREKKTNEPVLSEKKFRRHFRNSRKIPVPSSISPNCCC